MSPAAVAGAGDAFDAAYAGFHACVTVAGGLLDTGFGGVNFVEGTVLRRGHIGHQDVCAAQQPKFPAIGEIQRCQRCRAWNVCFGAGEAR